MYTFMLWIALLATISALPAAVFTPAMMTSSVHLTRKTALRMMMPGIPAVNQVVFQGINNAISLYSNLIFFRVALSFFPDIRKQAPFLKPVFTVTSPYLKVFRKAIPPIGGRFDVSAIPAIFILDLISQGNTALGSEIPACIKWKPFSPSAETQCKEKEKT
jgi:YggT family protein